MRGKNKSRKTEELPSITEEINEYQPTIEDSEINTLELVTTEILRGKIIVAEDHAINMKVIKEQLEETDHIHDCDFCEDGFKTIIKMKDIVEESIEQNID